MYFFSELLEIEGCGWVEVVWVCLGDGCVEWIVCDGIFFSGCFVFELSLVCFSYLELDLVSGGLCIDQFGCCFDFVYFVVGNLFWLIEIVGWLFCEG